MDIVSNSKTWLNIVKIDNIAFKIQMNYFRNSRRDYLEEVHNQIERNVDGSMETRHTYEITRTHSSSRNSNKTNTNLSSLLKLKILCVKCISKN